VTAPLVAWAAGREVEKIAVDREMMRKAILREKRGSARRRKLEARQRALTTRQLGLEMEMAAEAVADRREG
jgi:hypothetical protein